MSSISSARKQLPPSLPPFSFCHATIFALLPNLNRAIETCCLSSSLLPPLSPILPTPSLFFIISQLQCAPRHQSNILFPVFALLTPCDIHPESCHPLAVTLLSWALLAPTSAPFLFSSHPFSLIFPSLSPVFLFQESQPLWLFDPLSSTGVLTVLFPALISLCAPELHCRLFPRFKTTAELIYFMYGIASLVSK